MDDALTQDDGIALIVGELDRCWDHARPRQSVEDRKGPLRDPEGRQNGSHLHVLRGAEETQFSTVGKCIGDATASCDQGLCDTAGREI